MSIPRILAIVLAIPVLLSAAHFKNALFDVRLVGADSIAIDVTADKNDMMNSVGSFPYESNLPRDYRLYEARIEAYLQSRLSLRVDGKRLYLAAVRWKPDGGGRHDGFDSISIREDLHVISLGGKLPPQRANLEIKTQLWAERDDAPPIIVIEYSLFENGTLLRRNWNNTDQAVRYPIGPDSLAVMRARSTSLPRRLIPQEILDHTGHDH